MFNKFKNKDNRTLLEKEIDELVLELDQYPKTSKEYAEMITQLERLYKAKSYD